VRRLTTLLAILAAFALGVILPQLASTPVSTGPTRGAPPTNTPRAIAQAATPTATETIPPYTPLATLTPSRTLRPPPTLEPPTNTLQPSFTPSISPTPTFEANVSIPGLHGAETPTPASTAGCVPRKDWKLTYTVQRDDALIRIADLYNTTVDELMAGNCLKDKNLIVIGQVLKVPGKVQPSQPSVVCIPFELLTPMNGSMNISGTDPLTFDWRGPRAPRNLIRIFRPDGSKYEVVLELRQNESIKVVDNLAAAGTYTWYVYPLDYNFVQVCPEGGPWTFTKPLSPTITPTLSAGGGGGIGP
jgi:LysM repeat protein